MARFLKLTPADFKKKYLRRVGLRYSLIEKQPSKDCIFLNCAADQHSKCSVYSVRPSQCRTWPFWKTNVRRRTAWIEAGKDCPGIDRGQWYDAARIEALLHGEIPAETPIVSVREAAQQWVQANLDNADCLAAVAEVYRFLDSRIDAAVPSCDNCGRCCDFEQFGHRLFVTTLEMLYFVRGMYRPDSPKDPRPWPDLSNGRCPHHQGDQCTDREFRPAGCRIFFCRTLPETFQNELTEQVLNQLRRLHEQFRAVYYYADLRNWQEI